MAWFRRSAHPEEELAAYIDGELSPRARLAVEAHLAGCEACSALLEELRLTRSMLAELPQIEPRRSFTLGPEHARQPRAKPRRSTFAFAPVAAFTVLVALLFVDLADFSGPSEDGGGSLTAADSRQAEQADKAAPETFSAAGAADAAGTVTAEAPRAGTPAGPALAPVPPGESTAGAEDDAFTPSTAEPEAAAAGRLSDADGSGGGPSLLRILQIGAALALVGSLLVVYGPRIAASGSRGVR